MTGVPHLPAEFFIAQTAADAGVAAPTDSPPYRPKPPQGTQRSLACFFSTPLLLHYPHPFLTPFPRADFVSRFFKKMNLMLIFQVFAFYGPIHRPDSF